MESGLNIYFEKLRVLRKLHATTPKDIQCQNSTTRGAVCLKKKKKKIWSFEK